MEKLSQRERTEYQKIAKIAGLTACVNLLHKLAQIEDPTLGEMDEKDIVNIVARADIKVGDDVATIEPHLLAGELMDAARAAIGELDKEKMDGSPTPQDMDVNKLLETTDSILEQALTNPNANTGGIEMHPEVKIKETNLVANKNKGEDSMDKQATLNALDAIMKKQASYETIIVKLAEAIMEVEKKVNEVVANPAAPEKTEVVTEEKPKAETEMRTEDSNLTAEAVEGKGTENKDQIPSNEALKENPTPNKDASLNDLISKYLVD